MLRWKALSAAVVSTGLLVGCSSHYLPSFGPASVIPAPLAKAVPAPSPVLAENTADLLREHLALKRTSTKRPALTPVPDPVPAGDPYVVGAPPLAPVDPFMPPQGEIPAVWQSLDKAVRRTAADFGGRLSVVAVDLIGGARYEFRPNDRYYPASTFKLPVTLCTVQAIERGELTWETPVTFTKEDDDTVGQGGFATVAYGTKWSVRNLVDRSLISSNNVAVKMLARTLTWDGLAKCTAGMGGMVTRTEAGSTPVTARDEAAWWQTLWNIKQQQPSTAENLLRPLRQVPYLGRIVAGTPRSDLVTHKFGTYPPYEHDGAIVWGERPYILVVLTYGADHAAADRTIEQIARAAWDATSAAK
ncbi:MAG TPA: serine hydrolase [Symbiobacteriaceae bacterium]|nr:serine hydrolase [Symbiobacteriaceae bacterium]